MLKMSQTCTFKKIDERHVAVELELMLWSPKQDLIASSNIQGDVALHRLSWEKVWTLNAPAENVKVSALAWRPDGKILAVGYTNGEIRLCDTENKEVLHTNQVKDQISFLAWSGGEEDIKVENTPLFKDDSEIYLPPLSSLAKSYTPLGKQSQSAAEDAKRLVDQQQLNLMLIGTTRGQLHVYAFGVFPCIEMNIGQNEDNVSVLNAIISPDFGTMSVIASIGKDAETSTIYTIIYDLSTLASRKWELHALALKFGQISALLSYLATTIRAITESWEDILLEIDSKLTNYAQEKFRMGSGTVSDDFLELLLFGTPSDELEKFLLHDLTEKGLKKLGHSIDVSYSNIQKLVLKHLQNVSQALIYHLSAVLGMARWKEHFEVLGLKEGDVNEALLNAGSFTLKATEIQQVIDTSMKTFKAFFRWLYVIILRLCEETVPGDINKLSQQDLNFVADFLKDNFTSEWDQNNKCSFNLEKVGQYLRDEDLSFPPDRSNNPWAEFLKKNSQLENLDCKVLFPYPSNKSLIQQHSLLKESIHKSFANVAKSIGGLFSPTCTLPLFRATNLKQCLIHQKYMYTDNTICTIFTNDAAPLRTLNIIRYEEKDGRNNKWKFSKLKFDELCCSNNSLITSSLQSPQPMTSGSMAAPSNIVSTTQKTTQHYITDVQFYNSETITVLLKEAGVGPTDGGLPVMAQVQLKNLHLVPMPALMDKQQCVVDIPILEVNGGSLINACNCRRLELMQEAQCVAVSETRRLSCVLFANRRRVRVFEMEVEDEDEDDMTAEASMANSISSPADDNDLDGDQRGSRRRRRKHALDLNASSSSKADEEGALASTGAGENGNGDEDKENSLEY